MEKKLLAGIIPFSTEDRKRVQEAKINLLELMSKEITFEDEVNALIYKIIVAYFKAAQAFPDEEQFKDILEDNQIEADLLAKALLTFQLLVKEDISQDKFKYALSKYLDLHNRKEFENTLIKSLELLHGPDSIETGETSLDKAKELLIPTLFSSTMSKGEIPHGDITKDRDVMKAEYEHAKVHGEEFTGLKTGLQLVDVALQGMDKGQLIVIAAASGEGKSFMAVNIGWHVAVVQKKNVAIITAETLRTQYRRRVISRHSNLPIFPFPVEIEKIKKGQLTEEEEEVYNMVIDDFTSGNYGSLDISQVSNNATLTDIKVYLEKLHMHQPLDLVIIDYLSLLKPTKRRSSQREEAVELFKECKEMAVTFNKGEGIPVVTLHQISMQAREKVKPVPGKFYTMGDLADSSEAAKSADSAIAILRTDEMEEQHEIMCGVLKTRDSVNPDKLFRLFENYQTSYIGDLDTN